jgi:2-C-methyl-D-erythritol 4-phosphate cytidylyltransferase
MKVQLILAAAGMGARLGAERPKALVDLGGAALIVQALSRFEPVGLLDGGIILFAQGFLDEFKQTIRAAFPAVTFVYVEGSTERQLSVRNGLDAVSNEADIIVIHDAARPFVELSAVTASIEAAAQHGAATVAIPVADTILVATEDAFLAETPDRGRLWSCQTPQTFQAEVIRDAHRRAALDGFIGTDDASLVRRVGRAVKLVRGSPRNFKITTAGDLELARAIVQSGLV